jgi:hypothetical protein
MWGFALAFLKTVAMPTETTAGHLSVQFLVGQTRIPSSCPNCSALRAYSDHGDLACQSWDGKSAIMSLRGKFPAKPHSRRQSGRAKTDPINDRLYIMIALNPDVGKGAVGIVAADSKSFWQSVNAIKANGDAQRTCDPDKQGFNLRFAQKFANWLRHRAPPPFLGRPIYKIFVVLTTINGRVCRACCSRELLLGGKANGIVRE